MHRRRRRATVQRPADNGAVIVALAAAVATLIVPGHSMAGVRLGASAAAVRAELGTPLRATATLLHYRLLDVRLAGGRVASLTTTSARLRTREGFGVGTRVEKLQRLPHLVCNLEPGGGDCDAPGIRFDFAHDRVIRVVVTAAA
jgi:hypothetical protein